MKKVSLDNSSDEDDLYTNSAARLRALKKQRMEREKLFPFENSIELQTNSQEVRSKDNEINDEEINDKEINSEDSSDEEINEDFYIKETDYDGVQTRSRTVRGRRNEQIATRGIGRRTRGRQLPIDLDHDIEIVTENKSQPTVESCKDNNPITLSDDDNEDENYEMNIKVFWRSNRIDRLSMRKHDCFKGIFQYYADLEKVSVNEVLIMKKDKIINHTDTPASLKLSIIDILDGGIVNPDMNTLSKDEGKDEDRCTIKVQTANKKQSLTIPLKKDERFKELFASCAEQLGIKETNLKFYFDGEQISPTDTPESLDFEEEACIDLHIST